MIRGLVGFTGFVGSNLAMQIHFDAVFNTRNIHEVGKQEMDLLVVAAPSAVKWYANKHPQEDYRHVNALIESLRFVRAKSTVLFSTIDIYPVPVVVDEDTAVDQRQCHPYGLHRLQLEQFARDTLKARVIRLPGLFGPGLKKNIIFDFLMGNEIQKIDTRNEFQFYPLARIAADLERILSTNVATMNLATQPISAAEVAEICTGSSYCNEVSSSPVKYDCRSKYAELLGGKDGYIMTKEEVLRSLQLFVLSCQLPRYRIR